MRDGVHEEWGPVWSSTPCVKIGRGGASETLLSRFGCVPSMVCACGWDLCGFGQGRVVALTATARSCACRQWAVGRWGCTAAARTLQPELCW